MKLQKPSDDEKRQRYGQNLKIRIIRSGFKNQREFADACAKGSITYSSIRNFTSGRTLPSTDDKKFMDNLLKK